MLLRLRLRLRSLLLRRRRGGPPSRLAAMEPPRKGAATLPAPPPPPPAPAGSSADATRAGAAADVTVTVSAVNLNVDVGRFVAAQREDDTIATALRELRAGRKRSHWVWFVLPNVAGLGSSGTAKEFAIASREEAEAFVANAELRSNLVAAVEAVGKWARKGKPKLDVVMGSAVDTRKLVSCCVLFETVARQRQQQQQRRRVGGGADVEEQQYAALVEACRVVLDAAEEQGWGTCTFTRAKMVEWYGEPTKSPVEAEAVTASQEEREEVQAKLEKL